MAMDYQATILSGSTQADGCYDIHEMAVFVHAPRA